jgi:Xaa-Pro aminopeptidase
MVAVGALDAARERLAQTVLAALGAGEQVLRAGAATADVARAMAAPAEGIGAVAGLCHSLGHGVGVGDADLPRIAPGDSGVLEPGMVLVAHPTISDRSAGVSAAAGGTYLVGEARAVRLAPVPALQRVEAG